MICGATGFVGSCRIAVPFCEVFQGLQGRFFTLVWQFILCKQQPLHSIETQVMPQFLKSYFWCTKLLSTLKKLAPSILSPNPSSDIRHVFQGEERLRDGGAAKETRTLKGHIRVAFCLCVKTSLRAKPFMWNWVPLTGPFLCNSNSFSKERFCTKTRFEIEAQGNSERAYCNWSVNGFRGGWSRAIWSKGPTSF